MTYLRALVLSFFHLLLAGLLVPCEGRGVALASLRLSPRGRSAIP